jgi:hypothetical protein
MKYLVSFRTEQLSDIERLADSQDVWVSPEGDRAWVIVEADDEESVRRNPEVQEIEEIQPLLSGREYLAIRNARRELEDYKARFVDDPSGALSEARQSVGRAMEARGYSSSDRAEEASGPRREILQDYQDTDKGESGDLEEQRSAFNHLSNLLDRLARA